MHYYTKFSFTILFYLLSIACNAQNLIQNGSFEQYTDCPVFSGQLERATHWHNPSSASPDLFHACNDSINGDAGVPKHPGGFQTAHSGQGYAALVLSIGSKSNSQDDNYREYLGTKLLNPLEKGKRYCVSLYVAMNIRTKYSIDQMSVNFSGDSIYQHHFEALFKIYPQLNNTPGNYLDDTTGWTKLQWIYTADDNHQWVTIGNFKRADSTPIKSVRNIPDEQAQIPYYYIDDVSVIPMEPIEAGWIKDQVLQCFNPITINGGDFESYKWSTGEITRNIEINQAGKYWLEAETGCGWFTDTFQVSNIDTTTNVFAVKDGVITCKKPYQVILPQYNNYLWSTGETGQSAIFSKQGSYWVRVDNSCGNYIDSFRVQDVGCFFVPDAFTPNNDGLNDIFRPRGIADPKGYQLTIHNRWGNQVFISTNPNTGWNGMHGATLADAGTYNWYLQYTHEGKLVSDKGVVMLIR